ncbi:MAG TPA: hypothetical protein PKA61_15560, partial [Nitrospira sp.]|nr:hypothetical protein [Nitrospira sp.]
WTVVTMSHHTVSSASPMSDSSPAPSPWIQQLREEFRSHLETFYGRLKLAPPYESVEKAIRTLTATLHALPKDEQARIAADPVLKWSQFRLAFEASGLSKKHRGIIAGLARDRAAVGLSAEYDQLLSLFKP